MRGLVVVLFVAACGGGGTPVGHDCTDGDTRSCYRGQPETEGVGPCTAGLETCSGGVWPGVCVGDVVPFFETCNGKDDDCDGEVDNAEDSGDSCTIGGCPGVRGCASDGDVSCIAFPENECGLCGGPPVSGLGSECTNGVCSGSLVCSTDKMSAVCDAPSLNECEVCGGPAVPNLGTVCTASAGCAGYLACNGGGTGSFCDCGANICNDGGTIRSIVGPATGDLVITEVMPSPSKVSDTAGEWFEVQVMRDVDLNNLALDRAGDTSNPNVIRAFDCIHVAAGTTLVFAKSTDPVMNGGIATASIYGTFGFSMVAGSMTSPGDVQILAGSTVIDAISWTRSTTGKALQLDPDVTDATSNDNASNFCDATATYGLGDFGTPGTANGQCVALPPPGMCDDAGTLRAIVKPAANALVISEIMPNPKTEPGQEWFEITNVGSASFDLNGLGIGRIASTSMPNVINSAACKPVAPGAFALLAHSADPAMNGGLPTPDATFSVGLVNGNGDIQVSDPTTCTGTPVTCTTVYDVVAYTTANGWPTTATADGVSAQLEPTNLTTTDNDSFTNFCAASTDYGTAMNKGTPRAANVCP